MPLTGAAARHLRALAHELTPVVQVGKEGVTRALVAAVARALDDHELIKVRVLSDSRADRHIKAGTIASQAEAELVQVVGSIVVLFKPRPVKKGDKRKRIPIPEGYTPPAPKRNARDEDE